MKKMTATQKAMNKKIRKEEKVADAMTPAQEEAIQKEGQYPQADIERHAIVEDRPLEDFPANMAAVKALPKLAMKQFHAALDEIAPGWEDLNGLPAKAIVGALETARHDLVVATKDKHPRAVEALRSAAWELRKALGITKMSPEEGVPHGDRNNGKQAPALPPAGKTTRGKEKGNGATGGEDKMKPGPRTFAIRIEDDELANIKAAAGKGNATQWARRILAEAAAAGR